jgi:photosystem II stability/assembly factor-like uncharacterized protein
MCHPYIRLLVLLSCLLLSTRPAHPQNQLSKAWPFTLTWTEGKCHRCEIGRQLAEIDFAGAGEAWAVGFLFPYHGQGSGDYIMAHSTDDGRTWKELRFSATHGGGPTFSLLDTRRVWVSAMAPTGECAVRQTSDGGLHWKTLTDACIELIRFFNAREGYGLRLCQTEQTCFAHTSDGGRSWEYSALPSIGYVDKALFLDAQTGWIAGKTQDKRVVVLRTIDGGQNWDVSAVQAGNGVAGVRDVFFLDARRGWLITWAFNEGGTRLLRTIDGGKNWVADTDNTFQGQNKWLSVVRFLDDKVGFAFNSVDTSKDAPEPIEGAEGYLRLHFGGGDENNLLYTHDGGDHWDSFAIPRQVYDCQVSKGDLLCSAISGESGLWLVKVHPPAR